MGYDTGLIASTGDGRVQREFEACDDGFLRHPFATERADTDGYGRTKSTFFVVERMGFDLTTEIFQYRKHRLDRFSFQQDSDSIRAVVSRQVVFFQMTS